METMSLRSIIPPIVATLTVVGLCSLLLLSHRPERGDIALEPDLSRIHADVTAYSSSPDETWGDPFLTASGRRVFDGVVACPRRLPFGTQVLIGARTYTCWDRLHPKYDDRFDIWKPSKEEALEFGRRRVIVQIL
jgi:3D (Asp-Asp-Asp) domain-containing protein